MPMTHDQMVARIRRLECLPAEDQASYRRRLGFLAALGYAYILLLLLLAVGAAAAVVVLSLRSHTYGALPIQAIIALVGFAALTLRSLWIRIERPRGVELQREDAPRLLDEVSDLCAKLSAPAFDHILLTDDYNAGVVQFPRLGMLGWQENYLLVGLPYMQATTPEQFRAVLAHEIGHLSGNHGRFRVWIWRVDAAWDNLTTHLEQRQHTAAFLVSRFAKWYAPYFHSYAFVLMRHDEREADRYAAELAGARNSAEQLARVAVWARYLEEEYWPKVFERVTEEPEPPAAVFSTVMKELKEPLAEDDAERWLRQALAPKTGYDDTHPCLAERLAALGYEGLSDKGTALTDLLPGKIAVTAAEHFVGERIAADAARLDAEWAESVGPAWAERRKAVEYASGRLAELERRRAESGLSLEEGWEEVRLITEFEEPADAIPRLRTMVESRPDLARARFLLGTLLLGEGDESGIALVEGAIQQDEECLIAGCEAMQAFFQQRGRQEEAEACVSRAMQNYDALAQLQARKLAFHKRDVLLPPNMPDEYVDQLRELLRGLPEVVEAYLVRRQLADSGREFHVLGVVPKFRGLVVSENKAVAKLLERLELPHELPMELVYVAIYGSYSFLRKAMRNVDGSLIHQTGQ